MGPFFYNRTDRVFFQSLGEKNIKQKFVTQNPGDTLGVCGYGSFFFCLRAGRARSARGRVFTEPWVTPPTAGAIKIKRGVVYNPTIQHGYLLEKNRHPGRRQPWPLPPPIGPPRSFRSRASVDRAMGNAPYRRHHENLTGVDVLTNNPPWRRRKPFWMNREIRMSSHYSFIPFRVCVGVASVMLGS